MTNEDDGHAFSCWREEGYEKAVVETETFFFDSRPIRSYFNRRKRPWWRHTIRF